jgi:glyoxylase-like metal-dependent hydrolase (beta-lactamase superfamily II)
VIAESKSPSRSNRAELVGALERRLRTRGFPRAQMIGMVAVAGGAAFLFSALALRLGLEHMGVRYGLASVAGYFAFVGMIRAWIAWQRGRLGDALDAVDVVDVVDAANAFGPEIIPAPRSGPVLFGGGRSGGGGASSAWGEGGSAMTVESADASKVSSWSFDFDDAWPIVVAVIGVVLGALAIFYTIWIAPVLLAEVALDAALVTALYRKMKKADAGTWLGATLRRTWIAGAALAVFMTITGTALTYVAPEARSIGGVIRSVRLRAAAAVPATGALPLARSAPATSRAVGPDRRALGPNARTLGPDARALGPDSRAELGPDWRDAGPDSRATLGPGRRDAGPDPRATLGPDRRALGPDSRTAQQPVYDAWALRFAHVPYALWSLVAGAERGPRVDIAFTVWPLRDQRSQRIVLVDAGFYREKFRAQWKPAEYVRPDRALEAVLGIAPDKVTDIIVTHTHWDHADGADLFPNATVWIQKAEYEHYVGPNGDVLNRGGVDADDARMFAALKASGRLRLVDGEQEILPGIRVYLGGKHTFASQYVGVRTVAGTLVIASDNAYLYMNLEQKLAIAQTLDPASNLAAQARMIEIAGDPKRVIPGHDPDVFRRFPSPKPGLVQLTAGK